MLSSLNLFDFVLLSYLSHCLFLVCLQARYERAAGNWESIRGGVALRITGAHSLHIRFQIQIFFFYLWLEFSVLFLGVTGICLWDGQSSHVSSHPCSSAEQKGGSVWQHARNLPLPQEVNECHLAVTDDICTVACFWPAELIIVNHLLTLGLCCFQDFSEGVGAVHWPPRVGWKVFSWESEWIMRDFQHREANLYYLNTNSFYYLIQMTDLQIYEKYCHNKPRSESLWRQCSDCAFFQVNRPSANSAF